VATGGVAALLTAGRASGPRVVLVAVSVIRKAGQILCKQGVGVTGMMGLDGKLYQVCDYRKKIRGAAALGLKYVIVPRETIKLPEGKGTIRLLEPVLNVRIGRMELVEVKVEKSVRNGADAVTVIAADTILDVMDLLLTSNRQGDAEDRGRLWLS
jgi:predicted ATP-dependent protease